MERQMGTEMVKRELDRVIDTMRKELDRVEILAVALGAFSAPVPDYEPTFHNIGPLTAQAHELGGKSERSSA
jgi:hypothetical protein